MTTITNNILNVIVNPVTAPKVTVKTDDGITVVAQSKVLKTAVSVIKGITVNIKTQPEIYGLSPDEVSKLLAMMVALS